MHLSKADPTHTRSPHKPSAAVLYILHSGNLYGTERMALATLKVLEEDYGTHVVFAPNPTGKESARQMAEQAGYTAIGFETRLQLLRRLLPWFVRHRSIDVVGVGVGSALMCEVLSRLFFVRLRQLQVAHGGTEDWHAYGTKQKLNWIPIGVVAVSNFVQRKLLEHGVRRDSVHVVENFLSEAQRLECTPRAAYDPAVAAARPIGSNATDGAIRVAIVSRVDPIKRIDVLLDLVEQHSLDEFQFDVYGTGTELDALRERARGQPNIRFHGYAADVKQRLAQADLLLHLCPDEPFGLVVLEAFAARLVCVVPDAGGVGSLVRDGVTGLRFRANDAADLARQLRRARALGGEQLQRLADSAATEMDERFSQREGARRYREALTAAGAARRGFRRKPVGLAASADGVAG